MCYVATFWAYNAYAYALDTKVEHLNFLYSICRPYSYAIFYRLQIKIGGLRVCPIQARKPRSSDCTRSSDTEPLGPTGGHFACGDRIGDRNSPATAQRGAPGGVLFLWRPAPAQCEERRSSGNLFVLRASCRRALTTSTVCQRRHIYGCDPMAHA